MRAIVDKLFTIEYVDSTPTNLYYREYFGTSTDTKPTANLISGSSFTEVDTGNFYLYDEDGATDADKWVLEFCLQGTSSSSGGSDGGGGGEGE